VGADDELHLQMVSGVRGLERFEEQALRLVGRSIPELEADPRSGEAGVGAVVLLASSTV
jgi:hypothetical protein